APQQEALEAQLRVPGEITRNISDKLIRAGLLSLAGRNGDQLVPGRALDLITVTSVLRTVRKDEDGVVNRLPANALPVQLIDLSSGREDVSFASLLREGDRKSTRLNSSHVKISYAVFCLKKKIFKITI